MVLPRCVTRPSFMREANLAREPRTVASPLHSDTSGLSAMGECVPAFNIDLHVTKKFGKSIMIS